MLRRLATGTLAAALVSGGLILFAGHASAASCPTSAPGYATGQVCGITLDKTSTPPGGTVTVAGTGFSKSCGVTIKLDGNVIGTGTTTSTGAFSQPVTIPAGTAPGTHSLTAA